MFLASAMKYGLQFLWAKMLKNDFGEIHCGKCIVCLIAKGKDVILGLKFDILKKHVGKIVRRFETCHIWQEVRGILRRQKV